MREGMRPTPRKEPNEELNNAIQEGRAKPTPEAAAEDAIMGSSTENFLKFQNEIIPAMDLEDVNAFIVHLGKLHTILGQEEYFSGAEATELRGTLLGRLGWNNAASKQAEAYEALGKKEIVEALIRLALARREELGGTETEQHPTGLRKARLHRPEN